MKKKQKKGESEMNLRDLFCQFPQSVLRTVSLPEPENSVSAALLLTPGTALLPDYLYVGPAAVLPPELPEKALNLLLDREPPEAWCQGCNVAVLEDPGRMGTVFNDIQRQLDRQQQSLTRIGGLFSASLTHGGLQHLIGQAAELLGNPLMLLQNDEAASGVAELAAGKGGGGHPLRKHSGRTGTGGLDPGAHGGSGAGRHPGAAGPRGDGPGVF